MMTGPHDKALYNAFLKARYCTEALHTVHTIHNESGRYSAHYRDTAFESLKEVAAYFGCDLVARNGDKEAA